MPSPGAALPLSSLFCKTGTCHTFLKGCWLDTCMGGAWRGEHFLSRAPVILVNTDLMPRGDFLRCGLPDLEVPDVHDSLYPTRLACFRPEGSHWPPRRHSFVTTSRTPKSHSSGVKTLFIAAAITDVALQCSCPSGR